MKLVVVSQPGPDGAVRLVSETEDGAAFETIYLPVPEGYGLCLSSQGGCMMGCRFCATALIRPATNLSADDIFGQVDMAMHALSLGDPPNYVTFSGMGEPLANYRPVVDACARIEDHLPSVEVSISTVGFPKRIRQLASEALDCRLYLSLHAGTDATRAKIIPSSKKTSIPILLDAVQEFAVGRAFGMAQVSYLLLANVNDGETELQALIAHLSGRSLGVQILMFNSIPEPSFERASDAVAQHWVDSLIDAGIIAYVRSSQGRQIGAGCGQLVGSRSDVVERPRLPIVGLKHPHLRLAED